MPVYPCFDAVTEQVEAIIDFSSPEALEDLLAYALKNRVPCVLCSTGYTDGQIAMIDAASKDIPIFRSANMSVGIAVLRKLAAMASRMLGEDYDVEIVETHHRQKADAPSGTAIMLYDEIRNEYDMQRSARYGRSGMGKRERTEIGIHSLRGGTVAGEHAVCYFGPKERIELRHSAEDRSVFAAGSLRAARFLMKQDPGLYTMDDMLM